ncbi:anti-sigma factor domain-containing protein [Kitasatospora sp. NPDC087314]|uniref:anti-sigma factor n=1 Tax=Kitasatospora sp. NPDC087314 TaxID=3364068 RepID=UPI003816DB6B
MSVADLHTLTGAYAAHALDPAESTEFERHLAVCPACAQEVAEFAATLARLGAAQTVVPPAALEERVMAALPSVRQEAPRTAPTPGGGSRSYAQAGGWTKFALAACLAIAAGAGGLAVQQHQQATQARARAVVVQQQAERLTSLLTAPDARTATGTAAGGIGAGTVVSSHDRGQAAFLASGMPTPVAGTTYQLWFNDSGTMRSAGLLPSGEGGVVLSGPTGPRSYGAALLVTGVLVREAPLPGGRSGGDAGVVAVIVGSGSWVGEAEGEQLGDGAAAGEETSGVGVGCTGTGVAGCEPPPPPFVEGPRRLPATSTTPPQASSTAASTDSPAEARSARGAVVRGSVSTLSPRIPGRPGRTRSP